MASQAPEALQLREELVAALEGSQVLEHAGRALLLLLHAKDSPVHSDSKAAAFAANAAHFRVVQLQFACAKHGADKPLADRLRAVASGRCAQYAALCLGLAVLCDADGGPAYGLPPELLAALPTEVGYHASNLRNMSTSAATQLRGMVGMLRLVGPAPPGRRSTLALMLRVGWLAVDSARELTAADRGSGGGSAGDSAAGVQRRIMAAKDAFTAALDALASSLCFLPPPAGVPETDSVRAAEGVGWWRLAAAIAADVLPYATSDGEAAGLGRTLDLPEGRSLVLHGVLSLPSEPPFEVAAALEGGLLRCLERLMRRAGRDPQGREAAVVRALGRLGSFWSYLAPLLAYGEPRQAAALVATLRKLLRTVDQRAMLAGCEPGDGNHEGFLQAVFDILRETLLLNPAGAAPGEGPSPATQQLLCLLTCAACEWLPELARGVLSEEPSEAQGAGMPVAILTWLQLLAACCASQPGTPASSPPAHETAGGVAAVSGAGVVAGHGGEAAAGPGDGGWRALLLEEVGAVPLLDADLRWLVPRPSDVVEHLGRLRLHCLVDSCCAVAAVYTGLGPPAADTAPDTDRPGQSAPDGAAASGVDLNFRGAEDAATGLGSAAALRPEGATAAAGDSHTRPPLPWRPELLREAATQLGSCGEHNAAAEAEALAAYLERGGGGAYQSPVRDSWPLASALPPPAEARRLLPGRCANPACANLEGDSEADLTLKACAGCGAAGYCSRPCQLEHWRAGHKEACGRARGGGA
ncbi:hypothetical protein GPECTOR_18g179 [Gonium pectorale]|uniref:phytol kinase n=1 Tax=Gonium pectorale TaxID=33097 RepID=A0A150GJP4_GONPE|nr:hypothetical protein GPECTOR_18g179 [Gonium pectorale]|eukprot:KXZ50026.1 hypothetical protein GPECTOR_18g179 [Gonium pectorale]